MKVSKLILSVCLLLKAVQIVNGQGQDTGTLNVDCPAGEARSDEDSQCELCPRGYWRSLTFDDCQKCPNTKTTFLNEHAKDVSDCKMDICDLGSYFDKENSMECKKCPVGSYQDKELELKCEPCPGNLTTREEGANNKDICEFYCPVGYEIKNENQCVPCERGFYKDNVGTAQFEGCKQCPEDTTDMMGATSSDDCKIPICHVGQFIEDGICKDCPQDFYSDDELPTSGTQCKACPDLYSTEGPGSTSDKCTRYCPAGLFLNEDKCEQCARGYYKDNAGNTRFDNCRKCPDKNGRETTTDKLGSESDDACSVYKCEAGFVSTDSGCEPCDLNFYQPVQFPLSTDTCKPCPPKDGRITNTKTEGTTTVEDCLPLCDAGRFFSESSCKPCERGTYKENVGDARLEDCTICPDGKTTENTGAISESLCTLPKCVAGQYLKDNVCTDCDMDYYSEVEYPNSQVQCIPCGTTNGIVYGTAQTGTDKSSLCKPTCPGGKQYNADTLQCESCPIESFKGDDDRFDSCVECETVKPGYVASNVGSKSAEQCTILDCQAGAGYRTNLATCLSCPKGQYNRKEGRNSNTCKLCPAGTTNYQSGSTSCAFNISPIPDNRINLRFVGKVEVAINECTDTDSINGITNQVEQTARKLFQDRTNARYNGEQRFCRGDSCDNLDASQNQTCEVITRRKRAITHRLTISFVFNDISEFITDTLDNNANIEAVEVISQILRLYAAELSDQVKEMIFVGYQDVTGEDLCEVGEYRVDSKCEPCAAGNYGSSSGVCEMCAKDTFQNLIGQKECKSCADKTYTENNGSTAESQCIAICQAGYEFNSDTKTCSQCVLGYYKSDEGNEKACVKCSNGKTTKTTGSKSEDDCSETLCQAGEYSETDVNLDTIRCLLCPVGTYNPDIMSSKCENCASTETTLGTGKKSKDDCIEKCDAGYGYQLKREQCEICPAGQYNDASGSNPNYCKFCPDGQTTTRTGRSQCEPTTVQPVIKLVIVRVPLVFIVKISSCSDPLVLNSILTRLKSSSRNIFINARRNKYKNKDRSFCNNEDCDNYSLKFADNNPCTLRGARRKRRQTGTTDYALNLVAEFKNVSERTVDSDTGDTLPTKDVISDIIEDNKDNLSPDPDEIQFSSAEEPTETVICAAGQKSDNNQCVDCDTGRYSEDGVTCVLCPKATYQDRTGESSCKSCPSRTYNDDTGATDVSACKYKCPLGNYLVVENDKIVCRECQIGRYSDVEMVDTCTVCPDDKTTQAVGTKSAGMCIFDCQPGAGYRTNLETCSNCPKGQYNRKEGQNPNTCKLCPAGTTNYQSGSTSCAFDISPIPDNRINLRFVGKVEVAINECTDTDSINGITNQVEQTARKVFQDQTNVRYNGEQRFCHGDSCVNLDASQNLTCEVITIRKRAITHRLTTSFVLNDISEFITDTLDNNANIEAVEVISQILRLYAEELSDQVKEIIFVGYQDVTIEDFCEVGEYRVDSTCAPCAAGNYGSSSGVCEMCPLNTYQNLIGQKECKSCADKAYTESKGSTAESQCIDQTSNLPAILGGAIGGGGALLIIVLIIVGVLMKLSRDSVSRGTKHETYHDLEHIQNGQNDGIYDTLNDNNASHVDPITPYAIGYQDQSFEDETFSNPYRSHPSINVEDPGQSDEESRM